jgi:hypothetical protein
VVVVVSGVDIVVVCGPEVVVGVVVDVVLVALVVGVEPSPTQLVNRPKTASAPRNRLISTPV